MRERGEPESMTVNLRSLFKRFTIAPIYQSFGTVIDFSDYFLDLGKFQDSQSESSSR